MAKLSFDYPKLVAHPRFRALVGYLDGNEDRALGCVLRFWNVAQEYWGDGRRFVPNKIFYLDQDFKYLIEVDLAECRAENGVYAKGAENHFEWFAAKREAAHKGGVASAAVRKQKTGSAQPQNPEVPSNQTPKHSRSTLEALSKHPEAPPEPNPNPSTSISVSSSVSVSAKKKRTLSPRIANPEDEAIAREWFEMAQRYSTTVSYGPTWPDTVRMLREIDKLTPETIRELLAFVEGNDFWRQNALSVVQLRIRSKTNGLLKWENALSSMRSELDAHGLGGGKDSWAGFEEACAAIENQKRDH